MMYFGVGILWAIATHELMQIGKSTFCGAK